MSNLENVTITFIAAYAVAEPGPYLDAALAQNFLLYIFEIINIINIKNF
jgi:hypothetical protein